MDVKKTVEEFESRASAKESLFGTQISTNKMDFETLVASNKKEFETLVRTNEFKVVQVVAMFVSIATFVLLNVKIFDGKTSLESFGIILGLAGCFVIFNLFFHVLVYFKIEGKTTKDDETIKKIIPLPLIEGAEVELQETEKKPKVRKVQKFMINLLYFSMVPVFFVAIGYLIVYKENKQFNQFENIIHRDSTIIHMLMHERDSLFKAAERDEQLRKKMGFDTIPRD
jgi:cytochrome bd-type quinol oxidase subunit 2